MPGVSIAHLPDGRFQATLSQSWIQTFFQCSEAARMQLFNPDVDDTNEQHLIGIALHDYAQVRLEGVSGPVAEAYARTNMKNAWAKAKKVRVTTFEVAWRYVLEAMEAWDREQFPSLDPQHVEITLTGVLYEDDTDVIVLEGTPDVIEHSGAIADWKTTTKRWDYREKQRWAIQPTAYYFLAQENGIEVSGRFNYWIWNKKTKESQSIYVTRGDADVRRLRNQAQQIADQMKHYLEADRWALNTQSWLCSERWCPWWRDCPAGGAV